MNMMTSIEVGNNAAISGTGFKPFLDEKGEPSERSGPDLTKARPIQEVIRELGRLRSTYSVQFWRACAESGIDISVMRTRDGEDRLLIGFPCDSQEDLRRPRYDALIAQFEKTNWRRQSIIDLANMVGRFADNQPYLSIEEAAVEFVAAGGRIWVEPDGTCDETWPYNEDQLQADGWSDYPLRRMMQRYGATLRRKGAREEMAAFVLAHGKPGTPTGWTILTKEGLLNG